MRRKCNKCGKVRVCRAHRQGNHSCKGYVQPFCLKCQRAYYKEWYALNREKKLEYMYKYNKGLTVKKRRSIGQLRTKKETK